MNFIKRAAQVTRIVPALLPWVTDEQFLRAAYRVLLERAPDAGGQAHFLRQLRQKEVTRWGVVRAIRKSVEYRLHWGAPLIPTEALHQARLLLIQYHLPPAEVILDLGGAAVGHPEGALLLMGYPHRPREITIIDLPPDQRLEHGRGAEPVTELTTASGTRVRYLYRSMGDLADIPAASVDLVFSGESIEHISEAEGDQVCREAFRVLTPGGYFCLDTPNAALTRLHSPNAFIHPEHQKEYRAPELRAKLERWGFNIVAEQGVCPMPESLRTGIFHEKELTGNIRLTDKASDGYLFFLKARKPE